ncbi:hypothetical protein MNV49_005095 [Pseudohyphozyma bogoriensis]|nr:hypothetical protein MNV49_005095 [Pseudohyphozyma bogoriensis]
MASLKFHLAEKWASKFSFVCDLLGIEFKDKQEKDHLDDSALLTQQKTAAMNHLKYLNEWNYEGVGSLLSDDPNFRYFFSTQTLGGDEQHNGFDKKHMIKFMEHLQTSIVESFNFGTPINIVQQVDKIAVHVKTDGQASRSCSWYIILIEFEAGTDNFIKVNEMMNPLHITELQKKIAAGSAAGAAAPIA